MRNNFDVLIKQATEEYSNFSIILDRFSVGWMDTFIPSVFPHDLYPTKQKASSAELLFKQLCLVESVSAETEKVFELLVDVFRGCLTRL